MPHPIEIDSLDDPRVAPYRNLKDFELARDGGRFIAEGELVVRRLLASDYQAESVLLSRQRAPAVGPAVPEGVAVYVAPERLIHAIVGFKFHSGVLAVGLRKPAVTLEDVLGGKRRATLIVCPDLEKADNMGSLVRIAAAFGVDAMLLGERCCDPFWRQSVRVSMGNIFRVPIMRSANILSDMGRLRGEFGVELVATVLHPDAEPLERAGRGERLGLVFGGESQGLSPEHVAACGRRVTIPMRRGTDSLNVSVAAGIFLYHFTRMTG